MGEEAELIMKLLINEVINKLYIPDSWFTFLGHGDSKSPLLSSFISSLYDSKTTVGYFLFAARMSPILPP